MTTTKKRTKSGSKKADDATRQFKAVPVSFMTNGGKHTPLEEIAKNLETGFDGLVKEGYAATILSVPERGFILLGQRQPEHPMVAQLRRVMEETQAEAPVPQAILEASPDAIHNAHTLLNKCTQKTAGKEGKEKEEVIDSEIVGMLKTVQPNDALETANLIDKLAEEHEKTPGHAPCPTGAHFRMISSRLRDKLKAHVS